jgi:hypothetical protein
MELWDILAPTAHRVYREQLVQVSKEKQVSKERKETLEFKEQQVQRVILVPKVSRVPKVTLVFMVQEATLVLRVKQESVHKVSLVSKDFKVKLEPKV